MLWKKDGAGKKGSARPADEGKVIAFKGKKWALRKVRNVSPFNGRWWKKWINISGSEWVIALGWFYLSGHTHRDTLSPCTYTLRPFLFLRLLIQERHIIKLPQLGNCTQKMWMKLMKMQLKIHLSNNLPILLLLLRLLPKIIKYNNNNSVPLHI